MTIPDPPLEALTRARQALEAHPENCNLMIDYAHYLLIDGQTGLAIDLARRAATKQPADFRAQRFLSSALLVAGDFDQAVEAAENAIQINPADAEPRIHLAGILITRQRPREALPHLMAVVDGPNETPHAWRLLSAALNEIGRPDRAIAAAERAIQLSPNEIEYRLHRSSLLISRRRHDEALDELTVALSQDPRNASVWRTRSGLFDVLGRLDQALADAGHAVALKPENAEFQSHLAYLRAHAGLADPPSTSLRNELDPAKLEARAAEWAAAPLAIARSRPAPVVGFWTALRLQARIIWSLLLRDMRTRFDRSRLGYLWAVVEPIGHLLTLGTVFAYLNHGRPPLGTDLYVFYVTGLFPYLLFSHVVTEMMSALSGSGAVLSLPIVKQVDVLLSKGLLVFATNSLVAVIVLFGFILLGRPGMPHDPLTCSIALLATWLLAMGFGLINMVVASLFATWETFVQALLRMMYFASGIYYSPLRMPAWLRDILILNPVLQAVEWFRSGFFPQYAPHWLDRGYMLTWAGGMLVIGFALQRAFRRRLVVFG